MKKVSLVVLSLFSLCGCEVYFDGILSPLNNLVKKDNNEEKDDCTGFLNESKESLISYIASEGNKITLDDYTDYSINFGYNREKDNFFAGIDGVFDVDKCDLIDHSSIFCHEGCIFDFSIFMEFEYQRKLGKEHVIIQLDEFYEYESKGVIEIDRLETKDFDRKETIKDTMFVEFNFEIDFIIREYSQVAANEITDYLSNHNLSTFFFN